MLGEQITTFATQCKHYWSAQGKTLGGSWCGSGGFPLIGLVWNPNETVGVIATGNGLPNYIHCFFDLMIQLMLFLYKV